MAMRGAHQHSLPSLYMNLVNLKENASNCFQAGPIVRFAQEFGLKWRAMRKAWVELGLDPNPTLIYLSRIELMTHDDDDK